MRKQTGSHYTGFRDFVTAELGQTGVDAIDRGREILQNRLEVLLTKQDEIFDRQMRASNAQEYASAERLLAIVDKEIDVVSFLIDPEAEYDKAVDGNAHSEGIQDDDDDDSSTGGNV